MAIPREPGTFVVTPLWQRLLKLVPERPRFLLAEPMDVTAVVALASAAGRAQRWLIADRDAALIDSAFEALAAAARTARLTVSWPARAMLIHAPGGAWRIEGVAGPPGELMHRSIVDAVILDRPDDAGETWQVYREPAGRPALFACRCAAGRTLWRPRHPADALLAPPAPARRPDKIVADFRAQGCMVASAVSDLRVDCRSLSRVRSLVEEAASTALSPRQAAIDEWEMMRLRQTLDARLSVRVLCRDILAIPPDHEPALPPCHTPNE